MQHHTQIYSSFLNFRLACCLLNYGLDTETNLLWNTYMSVHRPCLRYSVQPKITMQQRLIDGGNMKLFLRHEFCYYYKEEVLTNMHPYHWNCFVSMKTFLGTFVIAQANCTSIVHIYNAMRALARVNNFKPFRHPPSQGKKEKKKSALTLFIWPWRSNLISKSP